MELRHIYTPRLERAIQKAVLVHRDQVRRTPDEMPYISHLFSVFALLLTYTRDEDTLIAGLLHDSIEDTDYTFEELERDFGKEVRDIVAGVTEEKEKDGEGLPWLERKRGNLENLRKSGQKSMLISAVDKIYNLNALVSDSKLYGDSMWDFLSPGADEKLWFHREVIDILEESFNNKRALEAVKKAYQEAHETFLKEPCPINYLPQSNQLDIRIEREAVGARRPLLLSALSARIFGYGKRNTN